MEQLRPGEGGGRGQDQDVSGNDHGVTIHLECAAGQVVRGVVNSGLLEEAIQVKLCAGGNLPACGCGTQQKDRGQEAGCEF